MIEILNVLGEGEEYPLLHPAQVFDVKQNNFNNFSKFYYYGTD